MKVNDFLNLKDEMEENVTLKRRSKSHGASSLDNEPRVVMNHLRPGRNIAAPRGKVQDFITQSTITSAIINMHTDATEMDELHEGEEDAEQAAELESAVLPENEELPGDEELLGEGLDENTRRRRGSVPHQRMAALDGEVYIIDSVGKFMCSTSSTVLTPLRLRSLFSSFPSDPML
jgi:hypothetical protein